MSKQDLQPFHQVERYNEHNEVDHGKLIISKTGRNMNTLSNQAITEKGNQDNLKGSSNFESDNKNRISHSINRGLAPGSVPVYPVGDCLDLSLVKNNKNFNRKNLPKDDEEEMTIITDERSNSILMEDKNAEERLCTSRFDFRSRAISILAILMFLLAVALAVFLILWMKGNESNMNGELSPVNGKSLNDVTFSPSLRSQISLQPSTSPSLSTVWSYLGKIESNGKGADFNGDMIVVSNDTQAQVYQLYEDKFEPFGEPFLAEILCTSESNRVVVRDGKVVRAYDFFDGTWMQVGDDLLPSVYPENISVSGDGSTITISILEHGSLLRSQIYRIDDIRWSKLGEDIRLTVPVVLNFQSTLSFDGNVVAFGFGNEAHGFSTAYNSPSPGYTTWKAVLHDGQVYGGGPSIGFSSDGSFLVTAGNGLVSAYTIQDQKIGKRLELEGSMEDATLAIAGSGLTFAYAWLNNLRVVDLVDDKWTQVGPLPEIPCSFISSLSFSSDGKLAIGCPDDGHLHIMERQS